MRFRRHEDSARAGEPVADAAIPAFLLSIRSIDELERRAAARGSLETFKDCLKCVAKAGVRGREAGRRAGRRRYGKDRDDRAARH